MIEKRYITVVPLVEALQAKKVRRWSCCGGGTFSLPVHCWGIVAEGVVSAFGDVEVLRKDVLLRCCSRQLQVTVGDTPGGVCERHDLRLNVLGKGGAPQHWLEAGGRRHKVHATHARCGRVASAHCVRVFVGCNFGDAGWSGC